MIQIKSSAQDICARELIILYLTALQMLRCDLEWLALGLLVAVYSYANDKHLQDNYVVICGSVLLSSPPPYFIFGKLMIWFSNVHMLSRLFLISTVA